MGGPLAKVGLSAKLGVLVFKACLFDYMGGPSAKVCLSAKYEHTSKLLLNNFQCNYLQEIHSHFSGVHQPK